MKLKIKLIPLKNKESILVEIGDYPSAVVHIDTFWYVDGNKIYDLLDEGNEVVCTTIWRIDE